MPSGWCCQVNANLSAVWRVWRGLLVIDACVLSRYSKTMKPISYARHRFPPDVIGHAVWLYFRFTLSFRDVEELLSERGIEVSYETIRCWTLKFGQLFAHNLRRARASPTGRWHLDESAPRRREGGAMI